VDDEKPHRSPDSPPDRRAAKNGAWAVQQAPWNMDKDPSYGLRRVFEYHGNHGAKYSGLLQVWGLRLHKPEEERK
jgi:hypothetical protein